MQPKKGAGRVGPRVIGYLFPNSDSYREKAPKSLPLWLFSGALPILTRYPSEARNGFTQSSFWYKGLIEEIWSVCSWGLIFSLWSTKKKKKKRVCLCLRVLCNETWTLMEVLYWRSPLVHLWPGSSSRSLQGYRHGQLLYRIQFLPKQTIVGPFTKGLELLSAFWGTDIGNTGRLWFPGLV